MTQRFETASDWLTANPSRESRFRLTLADVARRVSDGDDFRHAMREFLDEFALRADDRSRAAAISERPADTGEPRQDAFLGAIAEHLAMAHGLDRPNWAVDLDRFWFVSDVPGFRAISIAQSPAAFRRRGVLVPERSLRRV